MKKDTGLLICELDTLTVTAECLLQTFLAIPVPCECVIAEREKEHAEQLSEDMP